MVPRFVRDQNDQGSYGSLVIELLHDRRLSCIEQNTGADWIDPHNLHELLDQGPVHMALSPQFIEHLKCIVRCFPFVITTVARHRIIDIHNRRNEAELTDVCFGS